MHYRVTSRELVPNRFAKGVVADALVTVPSR